MRGGNGTHPDTGPVAQGKGCILLQGSDKPQAAAFCRSFSDGFGKSGFKFGESPVEILQRDVKQVFGDEGMDFNVLFLELDAGFPGQDEELPQGVPSAEVQARVRFGETGFLGGVQEGGEGRAFPVGAEDLVQVQETTASRDRISSQEFAPTARDSSIGRAAPTVVSYRKKTPFSRAADCMAAYSTYGTAKERRLDETTWRPARNRSG